MWVNDKPADDGYRSTYKILRHENQIKSLSRNRVYIYNSLPREIRHLFKNNLKVEIHNMLLLRHLEEMTLLSYLS